jgi:hypothetical protein
MRTTEKTISWVMSAAVAVLLVGCGGSGSEEPGTQPVDTSGLLRKVRNASELEGSLKAGIKLPTATDAAPSTALGSFSGTYTQEPNVDEFDAVRYDGQRLYVAPLRSVHCCWISPLAAPPPSSGGDTVTRSIRLLETQPQSATARLVGTIPLATGSSVQGLYTSGNTLIALTSDRYLGEYGAAWTALPLWAPTRFGIQFYDVSNPAQVRPGFSASVEGAFVESRRVGDYVYIVSRHSPAALIDPAARAAADSLTLAQLLPQVTVAGVSRPLVDAANCYITNDDTDAGHAALTSITVVPIANPTGFTTTCYNEAAYGVYVAEQALYVTQPRPTSSGRDERTRIHKFAFSGASVVYRGSAEIPGNVWRGGQADFRMNEHSGQLRVMTTELTNDSTDSVDYRLFVLRQASNALSLEIVGQLPNERRPEEIGKPNETLYGVRFLGDRAYAVTFLRTDPLYAIDLATPSDPRIAGQLEVPGFSELLHPVTNNLLLGLGLLDQGGLKLELFDVSTLSAPVSRGSVQIGGRGTYSEALYDRHAFAYLASAALDRLAVPANVFAEDGSLRFEGGGLYLFEIANKQAPAQASLRLTGTLVPRAGNSQGVIEPATRNRAFIHDDAVFYIRDDDVWAARWSNPVAMNGPY